MTAEVAALSVATSSTVNGVVAIANDLIGKSAAAGTTTQARASATVALLTCLNRETP